jgi:hypothetical protein
MKLYYQIYEITEPTNVNPPAHVGPLYVADREEALQWHDMLKYQFIGVPFTARIVTCNHEEGLPCEAEIIEEVTVL